MRTLILIVISLLLMWFDHHTMAIQRARSLLSLIVLPIQYFVHQPIELMHHAAAVFVSQKLLLEENVHLRAQQLFLEARLQKLIALESENKQLRALLSSLPNDHDKFTVAQLLAIDSNPFVQQVVLSRGSHDNVYVGQPALDAYGIAGQIISVGPQTSQLMLITDSRSAIPIQNARNGVRAIAVGTGHGNMELIYVAKTTDIVAGDQLISSGLTGRFPAGYPVGVVESVLNKAEYRFTKVIVTPSAHLDSAWQVLLVWPTAKDFYLHSGQIMNRKDNKKP